MKVLFFGIYDKDDVVNARTRIFLNGLKNAGVDVIECRSEAPSIRRFWILFKQYLKVDKDYDLMFLAYSGAQMVMPLAKLLSKKKIIADPIVSLYDTMIFDRKKYGRVGLRAFYYYLLDWMMVHFADLILSDTDANINYFSKTFNVPRTKFKRLFIGTDEQIMYPMDKKINSKFIVHFHGFFIPLHGIEYIIKAAKILENENIEFNIIGRGQTYVDMRKLADDLNIKNINFIDPVPYNEMPKYINVADITLGIFGDTDKSARVIPNKIYDALAMKKPVLTADTPAIKELLTDGSDCILCKPADPQDLADKILKLKNNPAMLNKIAHNGYRLFHDKLSNNVIGQEFINILKEVINN